MTVESMESNGSSLAGRKMERRSFYREFISIRLVGVILSLFKEMPFFDSDSSLFEGTSWNGMHFFFSWRSDQVPQIWLLESN